VHLLSGSHGNVAQWWAWSFTKTKSRSILLDGRLRTTVPWRTVASSSCVINKYPLMRGPPRTSGSRVDHRGCCKNSQNATYFCLLAWDADTSGTHIYHHAKFHTDQCHRHPDICNQNPDTVIGNSPGGNHPMLSGVKVFTRGKS